MPVLFPLFKGRDDNNCRQREFELIVLPEWGWVGGGEGGNCSYSQTFHFVGSKRRERRRENFTLDLASFWNFSSYLNCQVEFCCVHNAGQYDMCCEEVAQVSCGQCKQLVPAVLRHVMPCSRILRLEYTSTKRYWQLNVPQPFASFAVSQGVIVPTGGTTWCESDRNMTRCKLNWPRFRRITEYMLRCIE
jgi:hypothetical protein